MGRRISTDRCIERREWHWWYSSNSLEGQNNEQPSRLTGDRVNWGIWSNRKMKRDEEVKGQMGPMMREEQSFSRDILRRHWRNIEMNITHIWTNLIQRASFQGNRDQSGLIRWTSSNIGDGHTSIPNRFREFRSEILNAQKIDHCEYASSGVREVWAYFAR